MATQTAAHEPNPLLIFDALNSFQRALALKAAIELDMFTHIGAGATSAAEIARRAKASEKGTRILCDFMTIEGFLTKENGAYGLTPDTAVFLDKKSPAYFGSIAYFLTHPLHVTNYLDLAESVRKGGAVQRPGKHGPRGSGVGGVCEIDGADVGHGLGGHGADRQSAGQPMKVLDIAAGPGAYGIEIAKLNPQAQDLRPGLEERAGAFDRTRAAGGRGGSLPYAFPAALSTWISARGYDLILLPNFLHHFDHATNVKLLKKVRAALKPGGRVATVEFVPNDDRITPPMAAAFSMMMLGSTEGGDAYTFKELDAMFRDAGFGESAAQPLGPQTLILTKY